jgi:uncharacterized protein
MKTPPLLLAALIAFAPSALLATPTLGYGDFDLTKAQINEVIDATNASCPKKSDDTSSIWAAEPLYQAGCRYQQTVRSEARLNAAYKRTMPLLSKEARNTLRTEQRLWVKSRYAKCERDRNSNLGGALKNVLFYDCQLFELKRRTLWIELPEHPTTEDIIFTAMTLQSVGDTENAIAVLLPLAEKRNAMAQNGMGVLNLGKEDGGVNRNPNFPEALKWLRKAAAQHFAAAEGNIGNLYSTGHGVPKDAPTSVRWWQLSSNHGDKDGQYNLARAYQRGEGIARNPRKAVELYRKSIARGSFKASQNLAGMYVTGDGIPKDTVEAQRLMLAASDKGYAPATNALGKLLYEHAGSPPDQAKGVALFRLAAQRGNAQGALNVGVAYRDGVGIGKDVIKSAVWFSLASDMGDPDALAEAKRIGGNFSPADRATAQAFIKICGETKLEKCD